jgi:YesN/AraC family two-component response regulator
MIRVLLAEDQTLVRKGIVTLLAMTPDIRVVGEAADGAEALLIAETNPHEVAILDIRMPKLSGIEVLRHWKALGKATLRQGNTV